MPLGCQEQELKCKNPINGSINTVEAGVPKVKPLQV
jgi:hypothetical protein